MTEFLRKIFGFETANKPEKKDDFFDFINGKSADKTKIMRQVLREADEDQRALLKKYKKETTTVS